MEFARKVDSLKECIARESGKVNTKARCLPTMLIVGAVVPIVVWLALFFSSFAQKKEGDKSVRDTKKVFIWTVIVTLVLWAAMYGYTWYRGANKMSVTCTS
jgi:heme/copper-type cytochrome/quinol oxidase subunit 2